MSLEANEFVLKKTSFDVDVFLQEVLDLIYLHANRKHIVLHLEKSANVPKILHSDKQRLQQILLHLLSNAVKYTPQAKTITIHVTADVFDPHMIVFQVADQGIGIDRDKQIKLFKLFGGSGYLDDLPKKTKQGKPPLDLAAGFGLTITNMLCAQLGKELTVDSTVNVGTTFTFAVKSELEHPADPVPPKSPPHHLERARSFGQRHSILTFKSDKSLGVAKEEVVPLIGLKFLQPPRVTLRLKRNLAEEDLDRLANATQEFVAERDINSVRPFPLNHMVGGFSARGTTPSDAPSSPPPLKPNLKKSKKKGLLECEEEQEKPLLIRCDRGEHSPGSFSRDQEDRTARVLGGPNISSPTSVSFVPGKDIAENRRFLRALVDKSPVRGTKLAGERTQRRVYDQSMAYLNHPCRCAVVLLVDDTEINKIVLSGMLSRLGILHVEACNGLEALEILKEHNGSNHCYCAGIRLVLMDCGMPVMNGFEATQEIKRMIEQKEISPTSVVAVTSYEGATIEQECKDAGMDEYLNKPVSIERLQQCLHDHLDS